MYKTVGAVQEPGRQDLQAILLCMPAFLFPCQIPKNRSASIESSEWQCFLFAVVGAVHGGVEELRCLERRTSGCGKRGFQVAVLMLTGADDRPGVVTGRRSF